MSAIDRIVAGAVGHAGDVEDGSGEAFAENAVRWAITETARRCAAVICPGCAYDGPPDPNWWHRTYKDGSHHRPYRCRARWIRNEFGT